jgi:uncharacterized protein (TIGR02996 family)
MTHDEAFLRSIRERPQDDAPRLIYADWLEEQGGVERSARAALIRAQCRLAALPEDDPARESLEDEEAELLAEYENTWTTPLHGIAEEWRFERGFIEHIRIRVDELLKHAEQLFDFAPLRSLHVLMHFKDVPRFAACPQLQHVEALNFSNGYINDRSLQQLLNSSYIERLQELHLRGNSVNTPGIHALVHSPVFRRLRILDLSHNLAIGDSAIRLLARTERAERLEQLNLAHNNLSLVGVFDLFQSTTLPRLSDLNVACARVHPSPPSFLSRTPSEINLTHLRRLDLSGVRLSLHLTALLRSPSLTHLHHLHLRESQAESRTMDFLTEAWFPAHLRTLDLRNNRLNAEGASILADSSQWQSLVHLYLDSNNLRDAGASAIAQSPRVSQLRTLSLAGNGIGGPGLKALANSAYLGELRALNLAGNFINADSVRALVESSNLRHIRELNLGDSFLGEDSARVLGSAPNLQRLAALRLAKNLIGDEGVKELAQAPHLQRLALLDLNDNRLGKAGAEVLASASWRLMRQLDLRGNVFTDTQESLLRKRFGDAVTL